MFKLLFSNRWLALIWVASMLGSVALFVGKDGAAEQLGQTVKHVQQTQHELVTDEAPVAEPAPEEPIAPPSEAGEPNAEGEIFVNPETGQRIRVVRRALPEDYASASIQE